MFALHRQSKLSSSRRYGIMQCHIVRLLCVLISICVYCVTWWVCLSTVCLHRGGRLIFVILMNMSVQCHCYVVTGLAVAAVIV